MQHPDILGNTEARDQQGNQERRNNGNCQSCGEFHLRKFCQFRNVSCYNCDLTGHIRKVCRKVPRHQFTTQQSSHFGPRNSQPNYNFHPQQNSQYYSHAQNYNNTNRREDNWPVPDPSEVKQQDRQRQTVHDQIPRINTITDMTEKDFIEIKIQNSVTNALIYTGAQISCISECFLKHQLPELYESYNTSKYNMVSGIGGKKHSILGTVTVDISIEGSTFVQTFHVFSNLQQPVILGDDILSKNNCDVLVGDRKFHINGEDKKVNLFQVF